jgi:Yip1 domain
LSTSELTVDRRAGLSNVVDIIVSPGAAFARLRVVPTWGWAFLAASVLAIAGSLLSGPATLHALQTSIPAQLAADPGVQKLPPDQQQQMIQRSLSFIKVFTQIGWLFVPVYILIIGLIQGLIMTIGNAVGGGDGTFKKYFALSITVAVIGFGLYSIVIGIIVLIRGADSFDTPTAVQAAAPSLALLAPGAHGALAAVLSTLNVFYLWGAALLALGMTQVGRVKPPVAWITAIVMLLIAAAFAAYGARNG